MKNKFLKVGLLIDNKIVKKQVYDLINLSKKSSSYNITDIIVLNNKQNFKNFLQKNISFIKKEGINKLIDKIFFNILCGIEKIILNNKENYKSFLKNYKLNNFKINFSKIETIFNKNELVYEIETKEIEKIKKLNLDLLIKIENNTSIKKIYNIFPKGIIFINYDNINTKSNNNKNYIFWKILNKIENIAFEIKIENKKKINTIFKGFISTHFVYSINLINLVKISTYFLHNTIENLSNTKKNTFNSKKIYKKKLCLAPKLIDQLIYFFNTLVFLLKKIIKKLFFIDERWNVAYQFLDDWKKAKIWKSKVIKNPPNRYLADPFVIYKNNKHFCFVEDYSYKNKKAHISVYEINKKNYKNLGIAINEDFHLSYPFIFKDGKNLYMCPETNQKKDIRIYKCTNFPLKWKLEKILIKNISAVDTNIFYYDRKWWILTNLCSGNLNKFENELHLFFNKNLISSNWKSHKNNPIIFDPTKARNGGFIKDNGEFYRIFQKQGFNSYGESIGVTKINKLSKDEYGESLKFNIFPDYFKDITGTHTLNYSKGLLAIDFKRNEFYKI